MRKKSSFIFILVLILTMLCSSAAFAFQDLPEGSESDKIMELKKSNVIKGINKDIFAPNQELTVAQAIQFIAKGFDLNIDHIEFIKELKASDYFENVSDDAWYAPAFIIAYHNGLDIPKDIDPERNITREEYIHYIFQAMQTKADFISILIWIVIEDEDDITKEYMDSIQRMLIAKIVSLDDENRFNPKDELTRLEASVLLYDSIIFVEEHGIEPDQDDGISMKIEKISDSINKITIDWGEKPNSGYSISIDKIEFDNENGTAVVYYGLHNPRPNTGYLTVITYPKAVTYVSNAYEVSIKQSLSGGHSIEPALPGHVIPGGSPQETIQ